MIYLIIPITYLIMLNIITTIRLYKSELYEKSQKFFQIILIWILPLFGAVIVSVILNQNEQIELKKKNLLKIILSFIFLMKIKKHKIKKEYIGYGKSVTDEDIYHASFQASGADL